MTALVPACQLLSSYYPCSMQTYSWTIQCVLALNACLIVAGEQKEVKTQQSSEIKPRFQLLVVF